MKRSHLLVAMGIAVRCGSSGRAAVGPRAAAQTRAVATTVDWPLHNLDLAGTRLLHDGPDQPVEREDAGAAMALPARHHRRRQQPDDAGRRGRHRCT